MRKLISTMLIMTIISSIFLPRIVFSYDGTEKVTMDDATVDYDTYKEDSENGSSKVGENDDPKGYEIEEGTTNSIIKNLVVIFNTIPTFVRVFLTITTKDTTNATIDKEYGSGFSIQKLVFNKVNILDINFFNDSVDDTDLQKNIKQGIASFYYVIRDIAIALALLVLIYTGVRMAMASVATQKAQYKTMLVNWVVGFIILMILPYIMIILTQIGQVLIDLCESLMTSLCGGKIKGIENSILNTATSSTEKGFSILIPTIIYWMITFYQVKFFWMYGKRLFNTAFLVIISPLVLIQYVFDRAGDNQGNSFKIWTKEYALNVLIQPLHAALYMIFMTIASNIVQEAPILAVVFLGALSRGEKVLRNILRVKNSATVQSMEDNVSAKKTLSKIGN
ncbi:MAG: hypothetical protein HFJ40_03935 [Clostridia bacterium]|nr:hypothetical protein [Clostridia bacterium]